MTVYPVILELDDNDTWLVSFPDFPEAHTFGDNETLALAHAVDALATAMAARIKDREPIPKPSAMPRSERARMVRVPPLIEAKVRLYGLMRAQRVSKSMLARRLGVHPPQVDRLLSLRHHSRLDQLDAAFHALGKSLTVDVVDVDAA